MAYGEQAKSRDMQAMLEALPSEFKIIPSSKIMTSPIAQLTASGLNYLTYWFNGFETFESIADQLDLETVTVKSVLYKTCQQIKNLNDDLAEYFDTNIHLNSGLIAMKLIKGGFFEIVEPAKKA